MAPNGSTASFSAFTQGRGSPLSPAPQADGGSPDQQQQQPSSSPTGSAYRSVLDSVPFPDRLRAWEEHKRDEAARRAREAEQKEVAECTFRPTINRNSAAMLAERSGGAAAPQSASASTPLQQHAHSTSLSGSAVGASSASASGSLSVHQRLYQASTPASRGHRANTSGRASLGGGVFTYDGADATAAAAVGGVDGSSHFMTSLDGSADSGGLSHSGYAAAATPVAAARSSSSAVGRRASSLGPGSGRPGSAPAGANVGTSAATSALLTGGRPLFTSPATGYPSNAPSSSRLPCSPADLAARPLTREEAELLKECTFRPKVNPTIDDKPVRSRYMDGVGSPSQGGHTHSQPRRASLGGGSGPLPLPSGLEHCTFQPRTNPLRPGAMPAAALYVQAPIYERLARTQTAAQAAREQAVAAGGSPGASPGASSFNRSFATPAGGGARPSSAGASSRRGSVGGSAEDRERSHSEFLARQDELLRRKAENTAAIAAATAPTLEPELCKRSLQMVAAAGVDREPFLQRVQRDGQRKVAEMVRFGIRSAVTVARFPSNHWPSFITQASASPSPPSCPAAHGTGAPGARPGVHVPPLHQRDLQAASGAHPHGAVPG